MLPTWLEFAMLCYISSLRKMENTFSWVFSWEIWRNDLTMGVWGEGSERSYPLGVLPWTFLVLPVKRLSILNEVTSRESSTTQKGSRGWVCHQDQPGIQTHCETQCYQRPSDDSLICPDKKALCYTNKCLYLNHQYSDEDKENVYSELCNGHRT